MRIAVTLRDQQLDEIDRLVPSEFRSRAEVVRVALASWMAERKARQADERYERAYRESPEAHKTVDRLWTSATPHPWDELDW